ncbi:hypothetical protein PTT47_08740 [Serratia ureilytica]|uniref:hypothetical protein n=1 Tax=Serratia ureilytica TaxID=300181 RepID=UPI00313D39C1
MNFINIAESILNPFDFESKYENNSNPHNRNLAFEKMLKEIMLQRRKDKLELYKLFAGELSIQSILNAKDETNDRLINRYLPEIILDFLLTSEKTFEMKKS